MNDLLKKNMRFLIIGMGLFTLNILLAICNVHHFLELSRTNQIIILLFFVMIHVGFFLLIQYFLKAKKSDFYIFSKLLFIVGLLYLFIIPFGNVPDEGTHLFRSYEISEGHLLSKKNVDQSSGRTFPKEILNIVNYETMNTYQNVNGKFSILSSNEKVGWDFDGASLYSFLSYLPQAMGIFIARIFTSSLLTQAYGGRIFNFLVCYFVLILAFKLLPCFKKYFFMICFLPIVLQEIISLSPDGITISLSFLLISYVLNLRYARKEKITKKDLLALTLIASLLSLSKIVYLPICFIIFLIPKEKFKSNKDKYMILGFITLWILFINFLWLSIAWGYLMEYKEGINGSMQVRFILTHVFRYMMIILNTMSSSFGGQLLDMASQSLEWNTHLASFYVLVELGLLAYFAYQDHTDKVKIDKLTKYFCGGILVLCFLLIYTSLYVQWNSVGSLTILGIQGRYFLPLLLFLPCLCYNCNRKINEKENSSLYFLTYLMNYNLYALMIIFLGHL